MVRFGLVRFVSFRFVSFRFVSFRFGSVRFTRSPAFLNEPSRLIATAGHQPSAASPADPPTTSPGKLANGTPYPPSATREISTDQLMATQPACRPKKKGNKLGIQHLRIPISQGSKVMSREISPAQKTLTKKNCVKQSRRLVFSSCVIEIYSSTVGMSTRKSDKAAPARL